MTRRRDIDIWRRRERGETIARETIAKERERDKKRERLSEDHSSTDELKKAEMDRVKEALAVNGYPLWAFNKARYRPPPPPPPPPPRFSFFSFDLL